jgi:hypothetical protein
VDRGSFRKSEMRADSDPPWSHDLICKYASPGISCNLPEMVFMGILFFLSCLVSLFFLVHTSRHSKSRCIVLDQTVIFWSFLSFWQLYYGVMCLASFPWTAFYFRLFHQAFSHILVFIPMCLVVLKLFGLLFAHQKSDAKTMTFLRSLFVLFLSAFVLLGIVLSLLNPSTTGDADRPLALWCACTDFMLTISFVIPARLLATAAQSLTGVGALTCTNTSRIGVVLYVLAFGGRAIWNFTHYFGWNALQNWIYKDDNQSAGFGTKVRVFQFFLDFIFDFIPSTLSIVSVDLIRRYELILTDHPQVRRSAV